MNTLTLRQADRQRYGTRDFMSLAPVPVDEPATQAGTNYEDGLIECEALINQLRRIYGIEPEECEFFILENYHEFGTYHEAAIFYNQSEETDEDYIESPSEVYALKCERLPEKWDIEAQRELQEKGHTKYQPAKIIKLKAA